MEKAAQQNTFSAAHFIKEIGRGKKGARDMSREDARTLYAAMLDRAVSDLELGAILIAMRIKGESVDEIAGFLEAAEASFERLDAPDGPFAPIVIPSYNGARKTPNLTPLLALMLAREGAPVLVHGVTSDDKRVTTAEIFSELGLPLCGSREHALQQFSEGRPAFVAIDVLAPKVAMLLNIRRVLGLRNSTHTLVKIMQPFSSSALTLTSYTHPEYLAMLTSYFAAFDSRARGDAFLMRGTEGETVANARRAQRIDWFHQGACTTLVDRQEPVDDVPPLPEERDARQTAAWIREALDGRQPIPEAIAQQVTHCLAVSKEIRRRS
jgi:anthranilate phosphoribosyltransferase